MNRLPKEALDEYIGESREMCDRVSLNLGKVEKKEHDSETLNSIYRDMHSIKGSSHLFGFRYIGDLAHAMETALDPIRHKVIEVSSEIIDALYAGLDLINKMMENIVNHGEEGQGNAEQLSKLVPRIADLTVASFGRDMSFLNDSIGLEDDLSTEFIKQNNQKPPNDVMPTSNIRPVPIMTSKPDEASLQIIPKSVTVRHEEEKKEVPKLINSSIEAKKVIPSSETEENSAMNLNQQPAQTTKSGSTITNASLGSRTGDGASKKTLDSTKDDASSDASTIRIQVGLLDDLMNLVGELVLVRNQVLQFSDKNLSPDFQKLSQRLNIVTSELQNDVMKTRMQPVGTILTKFHRVVRDMSKDLNKKIELKLEGTETELDKTLIEAVKDPLTHLVRNSLDHGLETPEERRKSGKPETGTVTIRSYHEGGQVIIAISDDGRGLAKEKIGKKAIEKGLLTEDQLQRMNERDIQSLIFAPGFSTAEKVSNISGRGVGMDVVKTNIEKIGGSIDLQSVEGKGTTIRLKIPLTLAIIPALVVKAENSRFAIPQVKVIELVRLEKGKVGGGKIELLQGRPVYRLRGELLPLVDLCAALKLKQDRPQDLLEKPINNIVILHSETGMFGLIVDEIVDSADIVVKPLSQLLKSLSTYSGATIMGDGTVVLILDVSGLSSAASLGLSGEENKANKLPASGIASRSLLDVAEYLIVDLGVPGKYAIPLCLVNRLEEFPRKSLEFTGEQRVIRYRDALLPIINVATHLALPGSEKLSSNENDQVRVVVLSKLNRLFGLEVKNIIDIVQIESVIDSDLTDRSGIMGSVIRGKEVLVILDVHKIVDEAVTKIRGASIAPQTVFEMKKVKPMMERPADNESNARAMRSKIRILLAEDTAFFRRHVMNFLQSHGFQVTTFINGDEAAKALEGAAIQSYDLVITDIEMPVMDGFELVKKIRASTVSPNIPVVALTTRVRKVDLERGNEVGFNSYLEKFNGEILLQNIDRILGISQ